MTLLQINPNWPPPGGGPPQLPPGLEGKVPCWPPPCVPIGDYLPLALVLTAIIIFYVAYNHEYGRTKKKE